MAPKAKAKSKGIFIVFRSKGHTSYFEFEDMFKSRREASFIGFFVVCLKYF